MNELLSTFNSAWAAIGGVVLLVIWFYRIRIDTNVNTSRINSLTNEMRDHKTYVDNKLTNTENSIRAEISKLREEVQLQLRTHQAEQKEKMETLSEQISRLTEAVTDLRIEIKSFNHLTEDK